MDYDNLKKSEVPRLSHENIELKAEEVIEYFDKSVTEEPMLTPLTKFMEKMTSEFNIGFDNSKDLGKSSNGRKILGKFRFNPCEILIDKSIVNTDRYYFTLAHEFGHLVLHRKTRIKQKDYEADGFIDTKRDLATGKKLLLTERDWLEWQANKFASSIMMPRATVKIAVLMIQKEMGIKRNQGVIYLDNHRYNQKDFNTIINKLKIIYHLNKTNLEFRLKDLRILIDNRGKNVSHISELLKEE